MSSKPYSIKPDDRFGRWTVVGERQMVGRRSAFPVLCECGNARLVRAELLVRGQSRSRGCLSRELLSARTRTHGRSAERLYTIWVGMLSRCSNPKRADFNRYGGRAISVCAEWRDYEAFREWSLTGGYADDLSIDRIDNGGNYSPENCRWASAQKQARNRRSASLLTAWGETKSVTEWAEDPRCRVKMSTLWARVKGGRDAESAIENPPTATDKRKTQSQGWDVIRRVESLDGEGYKKQAAAVRDETGELIPGVEVVEARENFTIRFATAKDNRAEDNRTEGETDS